MKKRILRNLMKVLMPAAAALAASCTEEPLLSAAPGEGGDGRIHFSVLPPASAEVEMMTRATVPAADYEKNIYTLRILIFDSQDRLIPDEVFKLYDNRFEPTVYPDTDPGDNITEAQLATLTPFDTNEGFSLPCLTGLDAYYKYGADGKAVVLGDGEDKTGAEHITEDDVKACRIWVLANMGRWENSLVSHTAENISSLDDIRTRDDLRRFYGKRQPSNFAANRPFLPMVGTIVKGKNDKDELHAPVVDMDRIVGTELTYSTLFPGDEGQCQEGYYYDDPALLDLTAATGIGAPHTIQMDQIVAKVRFNVRTARTVAETDADGTATGVTKKWDFYFDSWTVENLPRYTYIIPHRKDIADYVGNDTYSQAVFNKNAAENGFVTNGLYMPNETKGDDPAAVLHNGFGDGSEPGTDWIETGISPNATAMDDKDEGKYVSVGEDGQYYYHFYTYGNRRGKRGQPNKENLSGTNYDDSYSTSDTEGNSPLYKTLYAPEGTTFLVLKGIVRCTTTDANGVATHESRSVTYKIAIGCNQTDDYNVYRNTCYTLHITVAGFDQNDLQVTYNEDNAKNYNSSVHRRYQISIQAPYLDQMDCHYDTRFVQFTGEQGDIRLRIYPSKEEAETQYDADGNVVDPENPEGKIVVEVGKKDAHVQNGTDYWLKIAKYANEHHDYETLPAETEKEEANIFETAAEVTYCIHAKEYVKGYTPNEPRTAWLQIRHSYPGISDVMNTLSKDDKDAAHYIIGRRTVEEDGVSKTVYDLYTTYEIRQYPPIEVTYGNEKLLVERFEEYNMAIDPGINVSTSSSGLCWGWSRYNNASPYTFYDFAKENVTPPTKGTALDENNGTQNTVNVATTDKANEDQINVFTRYDLHNDFAARYCYDKGSGNNRNWYLPALEEMNTITSNNNSSLFSVDNCDPVSTKEYWTSTVVKDENPYPDLEKYYKESYTGFFGYTYTGWAATRRYALGQGFYNVPIFGGEWGEYWSYPSGALNQMYFFKAYYQNENSEYYYGNVARVSCDGYEWFVGYQKGVTPDDQDGDIEVYPYQRSQSLHVRAVRKAPSSVSE